VRVLETSRQLAAVAAERWRRQYEPNGWRATNSGSSREVYDQLAALEQPTPAQVDAIIGHNGWTTHFCSDCNQYKPVAVQFDEGNTHNSTVCLECLREALKLAEATV
jgi:hypothetical protein